MGCKMTLLDLLDAMPRFAARHPFPVYVEDRNGELHEVDKIDFRNGCEGTVLVTDATQGSDSWDDDLIALRNAIQAEWEPERSQAAQTFDPTGDVISVEAAYRLVARTLALLEQIYD